MSERAITWAQEQRPRTRTSKFVLMRLAAYADAKGVAWAYVERLGEEIDATDRTVQRCLRELETDHLIERTGAFHHRNVPFYQLRLDRAGAPSERRKNAQGKASGETNGDTSVTVRGARNGGRDLSPRCVPEPHRTPAGGSSDRAPLVQAGNFKDQNRGSESLRTVTPVSPLNGDVDVTIEKLNGDMGVTPNGDMDVTPKQVNPPSSVSNETLSGRGRERAKIPPFEDAWRSFPEAGRKTSSLREGRTAFAAEVDAGADPGRIVAACQAYAGDRGAWGASGKPKSFHRFVTSGRWEGFAAAAVGMSDTPPRHFEGPDDLRQALVDAQGEAFVGSYLDRATWRSADRVILARTGVAFDQLRKCKSILERFDARLECSRALGAGTSELA